MSALRHRGTVLALGLLTAGAACASGQIECTSTNYQYQYCSVNTQNSVRVAHQQSKTACQYGRNWGYDGRGIWVNNGCSAIFEYGYGSGGGGGGHHHDNTGDAIAGVAAIAILAAIADSSSSHHHHSDNNQGGGGGASVPDWAVGSFNGTDDVSGTPIDISVERSGAINGYYGHSSLNGQWSGGRAYLGNRGYSASPTSHGIRLASDDGQMVINLFRN